MVLYVHGLLRVQDGRFGVCEQFSTELIGKQGYLWYFSHLKYFYLK